MKVDKVQNRCFYLLHVGCIWVYWKYSESVTNGNLPEVVTSSIEADSKS